MDARLLEQLQRITPEEQRILAGSRSVEKSLYTSGRDFVVDSAKMLEKGRLIDLRTHTRFVEFPDHTHNFIEISYMCAGSTTHVVDDAYTVELKAGDLLFLNRHVCHRIAPAGEGDLCVNFIILPPFFDDVLRRLDEHSALADFLQSSLRDKPGGHDILHFSVADVLPVQNLVENLIFSMLHPTEGRREIDRATMCALLLHLDELADNVLPVQTARQDFFALQAGRYIEENCRTATLAELAGRLRQSQSALSKNIVKGAGKTFTELLADYRFTRAELLLRHSDLTVAEIIESVGYENSSYFFRTFRARYGCSPMQYRRKIRT